MAQASYHPRQDYPPFHPHTLEHVRSGEPMSAVEAAWYHHQTRRTYPAKLYLRMVSFERKYPDVELYIPEKNQPTAKAHSSQPPIRLVKQQVPRKHAKLHKLLDTLIAWRRSLTHRGKVQTRLDTYVQRPKKKTDSHWLR